MHTANLEIQMPQAGRRRGRYSNDFKRQVIAACREPGVSTAAVALANGLNANLARRWVVEASRPNAVRRSKAPTMLAPIATKAAFLPVKFDPQPPPPVTQADIRIELQHGTTSVHIHWPLQASSQCAAWLREVLA